MNQILKHRAKFLLQQSPSAVLQQMVARAWCLITSKLLGLARFRFGRILLHMMAIVGDRCVGFHLAGILRELAEISQAAITPLLSLQARTRAAQINH
jgi:hypothetical protein